MTLVEAFLHEEPYRSAVDVKDTLPLLSPALSSLTLSQVEVASVFHLPLNHLTDPRNLREYQFRESAAYWACDVTDLVGPAIRWSNAVTNSEGEVGGGLDGRLEIWGLTGWYLNLFMRIFLGGHRQ